MKKVFLPLLLLLITASPAFAQNSFLDFLKPQGRTHAMTQCPYCHQPTSNDANFCSSCGREVRQGYNTQPSSQYLYCPYCHKSFHIDSSNAYALCQHCGARNRSNASFCGKCGQKVMTSSFLISCPHCRKEFSSKLSHNSAPSVYCPGCQRWYAGTNEYCTYCKKSKGHHKKGHHKKKHPQQKSLILLGSFTKSDYKKDVRRFPISTGGSSFTKIVFDVHITQKHAVIVNTIKIRQGGKWTPYSQIGRLKEGRNVFNVPVPDGSAEIAISFAHGQGSEVKVYVE